MMQCSRRTCKAGAAVVLCLTFVLELRPDEILHSLPDFCSPFRSFARAGMSKLKMLI